MGNMDNNSLKTNPFDLPLEVQYVRLVPLTCHRGCTLRFELLGCELNGECWGLWPTPEDGQQGLETWAHLAGVQ